MAEKECGTDIMYYLGCRCQLCKTAHAAYRRFYRGRKEGRLILSHTERKAFRTLQLYLLWVWLYDQAKAFLRAKKTKWQKDYRDNLAILIGYKRKPGRRGINWALYRDQLGKHADSHLAREVGVSTEAVAYQRRKYGVPAFDQSKSATARARYEHARV